MILRKQTHPFNLQDGGDADEDKLKAVMARWVEALSWYERCARERIVCAQLAAWGDH